MNLALIILSVVFHQSITTSEYFDCDNGKRHSRIFNLPYDMVDADFYKRDTVLLLTSPPDKYPKVKTIEFRCNVLALTDTNVVNTYDILTVQPLNEPNDVLHAVTTSGAGGTWHYETTGELLTLNRSMDSLTLVYRVFTKGKVVKLIKMN